MQTVPNTYCPKVALKNQTCHGCHQVRKCINMLLGARTLVWLCEVCIVELGLEVK